MVGARNPSVGSRLYECKIKKYIKKKKFTAATRVLKILDYAKNERGFFHAHKTWKCIYT